MAHCGMALLHRGSDYDWGMAVLQSAAEANPNSLVVVTAAGIAHLHCGSVADALTLFQRALRLSPRDPFAFVPLTGIAHAQMILGDYSEALAWATRSLALNPTFDPTLWMLIAANAHLARMEEARHFLDELGRLALGVTVARIRAGQPAKDPSRMCSHSRRPAACRACCRLMQRPGAGAPLFFRNFLATSCRGDAATP